MGVSFSVPVHISNILNRSLGQGTYRDIGELGLDDLLDQSVSLGIDRRSSLIKEKDFASSSKSSDQGHYEASATGQSDFM